MRILLVAFLLIFSEEIFGQDSMQVDSARKPDNMHLYFGQYGLNPDSASTRKLYEFVYDWKGTRYQHAGHSKSGVDCSGFACEIYEACYDTTLPGGCTNIYTMVDTISKDSLREGDLVFFKIKKNQVSHIGVYLGNDCFAHASVHSGVTVSSLNEAYYRQYYYASGRLRKK